MILSLETLRGLAALAVAFYHFPSESLLFIQQGYMAVYLFFSLSGFVICLNYFDKINNFKSLLSFQKKRFWRLYPIHIFVLIVVLLIQCLKFVLIKLGLPAGSEAFGGHPTTGSWYTVRDFVLHIFLLQAITDYGYFLSWNGAAWTISVEFYTYFIFGLLVILSYQRALIFILLSLSFLIFRNQIFEFINLYMSPNLSVHFKGCLTYFLTGGLMFFIYKNIKFRLNDIFFLILLIISIYACFAGYLKTFMLFSFIILIVALLKKSTISYKLLNNKHLVYLGTISYSFYMIHQVIIYLFIQCLKVLNLGVSFSNKQTGGTGNIFFDTIITISYTSISIVIAIFMYNFIEQKYRLRKPI